MTRQSRDPKPGEGGTQEEKRGNGGKADSSRSFKDAATQGEDRDTGKRETAKPGQKDKVWTNESKDKWDQGPTPAEHQEALAKQKAPKGE